MQNFSAFASIYCYVRLPKKLRTNLGTLMRISVCCVTILMITVQVLLADIGTAQDIRQAKITFGLNNVSLKSALSKLQSESGYNIFYMSPKVAPYIGVRLVRDTRTIEKTLELILLNTPFGFKQEGKTIILFEKEVVKPAVPPGEAILPILKGKVSDEKGEALPGVSIVIKGSTQGTTTNVEGQYEITLPTEAATLIFSFVGYLSQEVVVGNTSVLNITLKSDIKSLSEVVVVGYGTQKKTSVTAAVSTLKGNEIAATPITNLSNGLGGRLSGVIVKQISGEPGRDGSNIFIRGISSTGNNQPLLIVDGIPRDFTQLDPNTIETFTVLKDAAAVAPYGVAGANGVVLVTTKRGKSGKPTLSYNGYVGIQNPTALPKYVDGYQFALLKNAAAANGGLPPLYTEEEILKYKNKSDMDAYPNQDVLKEIISKNAIITSHNIEVSGGEERFKYYASLGYQKQDGMWKTTDTHRYNLAINLDAKITESTSVAFSINGRIQKANYPSIGTGRIFELVGFATPNHGPLTFSNGMYGTYVTGSVFSSGYQKINTSALYSQVSVEQQITPIPGLSLKGTLAFDPTLVQNKTWVTPVHLATLDKSQQPYKITDGIFGQTQSSLDQSYSQGNQLTYQASLRYVKSLGKHNLSALTVFEAKANSMMSLGASRRNYNLTIDEINMGSSSQADMSTNGASSKGRQMGLVYRLTYDFADKYLFEASGRYDGSYYFAPENRFGFFPAFSVGWRISEERFLKDNTPWLDNLKLRASYGEVGALAGSPFQYMSTYNVLGSNYVIDRNAVPGIGERAEPNPGITWERAKKTDVGLEATLWKGLLDVELDYFHEKRSNMLVNPDVIVPSEYGIGLSQVNAGIMSNQGFDFSIRSQHRFSGDLQVSLGGNFTYAKNKLLQVFETAVTYQNPNRRLTGRSLGTQFGFKSLGYFQENDFEGNGDLKQGIAIQPWGKVQPGDIRYEDLNGDGQINDNDLTAIGDPSSSPRIIYGISPSVQYKQFTLDLLFQGAAKTNWYYHPAAIMPFFNGMHAYENNMDYWTPENPNAKNPRITTAPTANNSQTSSFWMGNAAYLRLKSMTLAYSIPGTVSKRVGMQTARVYISGQNVFTWTKLKYYDPEIGPNNSYLVNSAWSYPQQKVVSVGINVTF